MTKAEQIAADKLAAEQKIAADKLAAQIEAENKSKQDAADKLAADKKAAEPTSAKLTEIQSRIDAKLAEIDNAKDRKAKLLLNTELFKITNEETAEVANIRKAEQDQILADQRNLRAKLYYDARDLIFEALRINNDPNATLEQKQAASEAEKTAGEKVVNELLKAFKPVASKTATNGQPTNGNGNGERGAVAKRIIAKFLENRAAGMDDTENKKAIQATGESRGTTGAVVLAYQIEIGEKQAS